MKLLKLFLDWLYYRVSAVHSKTPVNPIPTKEVKCQ